MKQIIFAAIALVFVSCKKDSNPAPLHANNQVNVIVILSSGDTIKINGTGSKAVMGCSLLGGGTFVAWTDEFNRAI